MRIQGPAFSGPRPTACLTCVSAAMRDQTSLNRRTLFISDDTASDSNGSCVGAVAVATGSRCGRQNQPGAGFARQDRRRCRGGRCPSVMAPCTRHRVPCPLDSQGLLHGNRLIMQTTQQPLNVFDPNRVGHLVRPRRLPGLQARMQDPQPVHGDPNRSGCPSCQVHHRVPPDGADTLADTAPDAAEAACPTGSDLASAVRGTGAISTRRLSARPFSSALEATGCWGAKGRNKHLRRRHALFWIKGTGNRQRPLGRQLPRLSAKRWFLLSRMPSVKPLTISDFIALAQVHLQRAAPGS